MLRGLAIGWVLVLGVFGSGAIDGVLVQDADACSSTDTCAVEVRQLCKDILGPLCIIRPGPLL